MRDNLTFIGYVLLIVGWGFFFFELYAIASGLFFFSVIVFLLLLINKSDT